MRPLSLLLQLSDSALPTGGFSHSFGMEQYLARGTVHDGDTFALWLRRFVAIQLTYTDALLMRLLFDGVGESELTDHAVACTVPAEIRAADRAVAQRLREIGVDALGVPDTDLEVAHPALEYARVARHFDVPPDDAITGHLTGSVGSLVQNAVRGIPIGQSHGQRVMAAAHAWIREAVELVERLDIADLGQAVPGLEIAQMQHERLRARMFMS